MPGEDGLHQRIAGLDAGDHVPDLLVSQLGWNTRIRYRLRDCRISIEHISAGDLIAVSKRDPTQRGEACGERECWLLLGVPRAATTILINSSGYFPSAIFSAISCPPPRD